ncbi:MAG: hypothetical protein ACRDGT_08140, partial [Candidatus Limnocylindria bacterium]
RAVWPASRATLVRRPGGDPVEAARARFLSDHAERYGPVTSYAATAFDALTLLSLAAADGGADDPERSRAGLERINMPLIASTYEFTPQRHSGTHPDDTALVRWSGEAVTPARPPVFGTGIATPSPSPSPSPLPSPSPRP